MKRFNVCVTEELKESGGKRQNREEEWWLKMI